MVPKTRWTSEHCVSYVFNLLYVFNVYVHDSRNYEKYVWIFPLDPRYQDQAVTHKGSHFLFLWLAPANYSAAPATHKSLKQTYYPGKRPQTVC